MFALRRLAALVAMLALIAGACGGDDDTANPPAPEPTLVPADDGSTQDAAADESDDDEPAPTPEPTEAATATPEPVDPLTVDTASGTVIGLAGDTTNAWLAIPYAAPPVADLRWQAPRPAEPWADDFKATEPGAACAQGDGGITTTLVPQPAAAEDCLTLSLWSPHDSSAAPVMVWFHGGGLSSGSAHSPLYDGADLADNGVVVVTVNYRLGALGWLTFPEAAEEAGGAVGNYGLLDQAAALQWVQDNIAGFGGDPDNVTIFGESGGALATCGHLGADWAGDLFHKAIIQSGYGGCVELPDLDTAVATSLEAAAGVGCEGDDVLACLRALPVEDLTDAGGLSSPVADGQTLTTSVYELAATASLPDVSILIGSNRDEATLFAFGVTEYSDAELTALASDAYGDRAGEVLALYLQADNLERGLTLSTDATFACWTRLFAETAAAQDVPVFQYEYAFASDLDPFGLGATHAAEVITLFANPTGVTGLPPEFDESTAAISDALQTAWVGFATTGSPDAPVTWEPVQADGVPFMTIDREWSTATTFRDGRCTPLADLGLLG